MDVDSSELDEESSYSFQPFQPPPRLRARARLVGELENDTTSSPYIVFQFPLFTAGDLVLRQDFPPRRWRPSVVVTMGSGAEGRNVVTVCVAAALSLAVKLQLPLSREDVSSSTHGAETILDLASFLYSL